MIRAYFRNDFTPTGKHPQGCHYLNLSNQAQVTLHTDGGTFYTTIDPGTPIHAEIREWITRFSYRGEHLMGTPTSKRITPGHYVCGKFSAEVRLDFRHGHSLLVITANAPTRSLLTRLVRVLENGEDIPAGVRTPPQQPKPSTIPMVHMATPGN